MMIYLGMFYANHRIGFLIYLLYSIASLLLQFWFRKVAVPFHNYNSSAQDISHILNVLSLWSTARSVDPWTAADQAADLAYFNTEPYSQPIVLVQGHMLKPYL